MKLEIPKVFNKIDLIVLLSSVFVFLAFGLFHLTKFETTDEHFWKYDRIEKYYNGISEGFSSGEWKKTRINDKPGVTNALISGISVPVLGLEPGKHNDIEGEKMNSFYDKKSGKHRDLYDMYHVEDTERINLALRLPGLLFNAIIMLPLIFWLTLKITKNKLLTHLNIVLIGMSPIFIGISQIVNPDTFLWSFSAVGIISYIAYLYRREKKFIIIAGVATGFALLSKYSANLLFIFYPAIFILHAFFNEKQEISIKKMLKGEVFRRYILSFMSLAGIAFIVFSILMPDVIFEPRHFLYGTTYSPTLAPIVDIFIDLFNMRETIFYTQTKYRTLIMLPVSLVVFGFMTVVIPVIGLWLMQKMRKFWELILKGVILLMFFIFIFSFANAWFDTPFFSLENIKEESRASGKLVFPDFADDSPAIFWLKALTVQAQNLVFSLSPIVVFAVLFLWARVVQGKLFQKKKLPIIYLFSVVAPLVFFIGALMANIFVNIRYSIMLFPMFLFLGALGIIEILKTLSSKYPKLNLDKVHMKYLMLVVVVVTQLYALWSIKPYYFNYHSTLLPKEYVVTDSWGYGAYEAAMYINSLPKASELMVWTDRRGACQFLEGKCIVSNELYLDETDVDYFIFSRRGMITKRFKPIGLDKQSVQPSKYYGDENFLKENTVFELNIGDRPSNFIKVVKVAK